MKRLEAGARARRGRAAGRGRLRRAPVPGQGLHRAGRAARRTACASSSTPAIVTGTAWVTGADKADHHVVDLVVGRDFTPDGTIEAAEVRAGDPSPDGSGAARGRPRHRDRAHLPARPQVRRRLRPRRARPGQQADPHHDGLLRRRGVAAGRRDRRAEPRRARPGLAALGGAVRRAPGRSRASSDEIVGGRGGRSPPQLDAAGLRVLLDDRKASPGVKFADAELVGVPDDRRRRARPGRRRDRGQGPPQRGAGGDRARRGGRAPRRDGARVGSPDRSGAPERGAPVRGSPSLSAYRWARDRRRRGSPSARRDGTLSAMRVTTSSVTDDTVGFDGYGP